MSMTDLIDQRHLLESNETSDWAWRLQNLENGSLTNAPDLLVNATAPNGTWVVQVFANDPHCQGTAAGISTTDDRELVVPVSLSSQPDGWVILHYQALSTGGASVQCTEAGLTVLRDATPPEAPTDVMIATSANNDPVITGTPMDNDAHILVFINGTCSGPPIRMADGAELAAGIILAVVPGSYNFSILAADEAGNRSPCSIDLAFDSGTP